MKKKPTAASASPQAELVPVRFNILGKVGVVRVCPGDERVLAELLTEVLADSNRTVARLEQQATSRQRKRALSTERFERGLLLVKWIDHLGGGELTKELVNEIKDGCPDWPCVQDYKRHRSREKLRNALRNLAADTRKALGDRRLPGNWGGS
jgi:hypothetical protein